MGNNKFNFIKSASIPSEKLFTFISNLLFPERNKFKSVLIPIPIKSLAKSPKAFRNNTLNNL